MFFSLIWKPTICKLRVLCSDLLSERIRWAHLPRSEIHALVPQKKFSFWPYSKFFMNPTFSVKMAIKDICLVLIAISVIDIHFVCVYKNSKNVLANTQSSWPNASSIPSAYKLLQYAIVSRQRRGSLAVFDTIAPKKMAKELTAIRRPCRICFSWTEQMQEYAWMNDIYFLRSIRKEKTSVHICDTVLRNRQSFLELNHNKITLL